MTAMTFTFRPRPVAILGALATLIASACNDATGPVDPGPRPIPPDTTVNSLTIEPGTLQLLPEDTVRLTATVFNKSGDVLSGRTITWTSTNETAAIVSPSGLVTAVSGGSAIIRAAAGSVKAEATVAVTPLNPTPSITGLSPDSAEATFGIVEFTVLGENFSPSAQVLWDDRPRPTNFVSPTELRVVVGGNDVAQPGPRIITVRNPEPGGGVSQELTFRVIAPVASIVVTPGTLLMTVGQQAQLNAHAYAEDGGELINRVFVWTSSSSGTVSVDANGGVAARRVGTAYIFVSVGNRSAQVRVDVVAPVAHVHITPNPAGVLVGQTRQLTARTLLANGIEVTGRDVTWNGTNPSVAYVDEQGRVTGLVKGHARIQAESEGVVSSVSIEVRQWAPVVNTLELRNSDDVIVQPSVGTTTYVDPLGNSHTASLYIDGGALTLQADVGRYRREFTMAIVVAQIGEVGHEVWVDEGAYGYHFMGGFWLTSDTTGESLHLMDIGYGEFTVRQTVGTAPEAPYRWVLQ